MSGRAAQPSDIQGYACPGFEAVRAAFAENFARRNELGAACCIFHQGEKVVDLWGGMRNVATGEPWEEDTMVLVFSATKGLAAMVMAVAHSRGLARLRGTRLHLLAGVCSTRQGQGYRPPTAGAPGGAVWF